MIRPGRTKLVLSCIMLVSFVCLASCQGGAFSETNTDLPQYIPFLEDLQIDGDLSDWPSNYKPVRIHSDIYGNVPDSSDFHARFRLAWNHAGLFILAEVWDDFIYEDSSRFWNGDGLELFVSPNKGSFDIVQISVRPSYELPDSLAAVNTFDHRRTDSLKAIPAAAVFCTQKFPGKYMLEGLVPLEMLGLENPVSGSEVAVQIYLNDTDQENDTMNFSLPWYPGRESYRNPYAFHSVRFSHSDHPDDYPEIRAWIVDDETLHLKILSENSCRDKSLSILSDMLEARFNLNEQSINLYSREWELPLKESQSSNSSFHFLRNDSLFTAINLCEFSRLYKNIPEPNRFEDEIVIFEIIDHYDPPPDNITLFTGSSTIRKWNNIENDLPGITLINRGFGGSTMKDLNYYFKRIVMPYNPVRIFVYEGDNDIARGVSPEAVRDDYREFIENCKENIPDAEIYILSIKPSLSRMRNWKDMERANQLLENLSAKYNSVHFIDISTDMLRDDGTPQKDIFELDRLHLNEKGYQILANAVQRYLYK